MTAETNTLRMQIFSGLSVQHTLLVQFMSCLREAGTLLPCFAIFSTPSPQVLERENTHRRLTSIHNGEIYYNHSREWISHISAQA
eukprot:6193345-Pleurochrysis_carterae.AAC.1